MRGDPRGVLLFALELSLLRGVRNAGGVKAITQAEGSWDAAAELCRLGLLRRSDDVLTVTLDGEKALRLTVDVPEGRVGFVSTQKWNEA